MGAFVRTFTGQDVPAALELSSAAGWNQTAADWQVPLELEPEGCLGVECEGRLVATTTLICYGTRLAWIGMVLTHPLFRRRGFARELVQRAVDLAQTRGIATVKLDATEQGSGLYRSLGFDEEQQIERWSGTSSGYAPAVKPRLSVTEIAALDRQAFGADREGLLEALMRYSEPRGGADGYVLSRPGAQAGFLGPCVARSKETAHTLIEEALRGDRRRWFWDLLPSNGEACALAAELGFQRERRLVRMVRGAAMRGEDTLVYGGAGFEFG